MVKWLPIAYVLLVLVFSPRETSGYDHASLYDQAILLKALQIYEQKLRGLWEEDLLAKLPVREQDELRDVVLELPLIGTNRSVLDYYADLPGRRVVIPILSVQFLDDLVTTWAWLEKRGCNNLLLFNYVAVLRHQGPLDLHNGPRNTFGVPPNIFSDEFIYDVSGKALKSTIYFLTAHEAGHLLYRHLPYAEIDSLEIAQQQEMQADAFALDVMRRIGVAPTALAMFFSVTTVFEAVPADFASLSEYKRLLKSRSTHPLSSERLSAVAEQIRENAGQFARLQNDQTKWESQFQIMAEQITKLAEELDSREIRLDLKRRGLTAKPAQLASACKK
jgi:hypothetical protein